MASITKRETKKGIVYKAEVRRRGYRESKTFPKKAMALAWASRRETELAEPGALDAARSGGVTVKQLIERYEKTFNYEDQWGRSKAHDMQRLKTYDIAEIPVGSITSADLVKHIIWRRKTCGASTAKNDLIWLRVAFKIAAPAFDIAANVQAIDDANTLCEAQGLVSRSNRRSRRPTLDELNLILDYADNAPKSKLPMSECILFLLFSGRRDAEMCRITWADLDDKKRRVVVRDMKHPRKKWGNHVTVQLTDQAWDIIQRQEKTSEFIFPYNPSTISGRFTKSCKMVGVRDLRLHDLRHECASWLGELAHEVPFIAQITGHRDWNMLQRYTHVDEKGDKYADWHRRP